MPDDARVLVHFLVELELPLQYCASVQQLELVVQVVPVQLVVPPQRPVIELHVTPLLQYDEEVRQSGTQVPLEEQTLPVLHGFAAEQVFAQTILPLDETQVAPEPQSLAASQVLVHVPTDLPVSFTQSSEKSPAQSASVVHGLPRSALAGGASPVVLPSPVVEPSSGHGPASPPQG